MDAKVEWHVPPTDADWTAHVAGLDCDSHLELAATGDVPYGGQIELRDPPAPDAAEWPMPTWRRKLAERPPTGDWWRRRHHCSDAVLGSNHPEDDLPF